MKKIKRLVDRMFVIFPFEVDFYARYDYPVQYAGNPLVDAIHDRPFKNETFNEFVQVNGLSGKPIIALVAGSRSQELKHVLPKLPSGRLMRNTTIRSPKKRCGPI